MDQKYVYDMCLECDEVICNPICLVCLSNEIKSWTEYKSLKALNKLGKEITDYIEKNKNFIGNSMGCVVCGEENVFICHHRFTKMICDILKDSDVNRKVFIEFFILFNYKGKIKNEQYGEIKNERI